VESGARVRNTWVINPLVWDNLGKPGLIPDELARSSGLVEKDPTSSEGGSPKDELAAHQLDGEVKAHHGQDG
jgi:hypothetical protein